jgi:hypothetical protein
MNLSKNIKVTVVSPAASAATGTITSSVLDMAGYEGVMYLALTGDATSGTVLTLTAKENTANSTSSPTPTTGPSCTVTSASASDCDSKVLIVDEYRPVPRYNFCTLVIGTQNCVVGGIIAIQYQAHSRPTSQDASVIASGFAAGA